MPACRMRSDIPHSLYAAIHVTYKASKAPTGPFNRSQVNYTRDPELDAALPWYSIMLCISSIESI